MSDALAVDRQADAVARLDRERIRLEEIGCIDPVEDTESLDPPATPGGCLR